MAMAKGIVLSDGSHLDFPRDFVLFDREGIRFCPFFDLFSLLTGLEKAKSILVLILERLLDESFDNDCSRCIM